jgi:anti-anti-sigma factor
VRKTRAGSVGLNSGSCSAYGMMIETSQGDSLPLTVTSRIENHVAVLELVGSLTIGPALQTVREAVRQVLSTNQVTEIILHMAGVTSVDSSGLGELTVAYTVATKRGCSIRLAMVNPNLKKLLEMTRLDELLL